MRTVADTDVLSTFARIHRLDILKKLFEQIIITPSVKSELNKGKIEIRALNPIIARLTREELKELRKTDIRLDKGERECIVVAKSRFSRSYP